MAKFQGGDLITDGRGIYIVESADSNNYSLIRVWDILQGFINKKIREPRQCRQNFVEKCSVIFNLDNLPTKISRIGTVKCEQCGRDIEVGQDCIKSGYEFFCDAECLSDYMGFVIKKLEEDDLKEFEEVVVPVFEIDDESIKSIQKVIDEFKKGSVIHG